MSAKAGECARCGTLALYLVTLGGKTYCVYCAHKVRPA